MPGFARCSDSFMLRLDFVTAGRVSSCPASWTILSRSTHRTMGQENCGAAAGLLGRTHALDKLHSWMSSWDWEPAQSQALGKWLNHGGIESLTSCAPKLSSTSHTMRHEQPCHARQTSRPCMYLLPPMPT